MAEAREAESRVARLRRQEFHYPITLVPGIVAVADVLLVLASAFFTCNHLIILTDETRDQYLFASVFIAFVSVVLFQRADLYELGSLMRPLRNSDAIFAGVGTSFLFFLSILFALKSNDVFDIRWVGYFALATLISIVAFRICAYWLLRWLGDSNRIGRRFAVLGAGDQAVRVLAEVTKLKPYFTSILGVYADDAEGRPKEIGGFPFVGGQAQLLTDVRAGLIDDVLIAMPWNDSATLRRTIEQIKELPVNVHIASDLAGYRLQFRPVLGASSQMTVFEVEQRPIAGWSSLLKSAEDYVLASVFILLVSPILLIVALAIKLDDGGPIFFMQKRLGFNNKVFEIYKFRSMHVSDAPEEQVRQATRGDPRVTRVGRIIRATSLDELPQLLNVLNGTMSIVGPRPHALSHNEEYGDQIRGYFARHKVKPGITGWAQVNGFRGETDEIGKMEERIRHDVIYAENWSLLFDLRIIVTTAVVLFFQRTAY